MCYSFFLWHGLGISYDNQIGYGVVCVALPIELDLTSNPFSDSIKVGTDLGFQKGALPA